MRTGSLKGKLTIFPFLHTILMKMQLSAWMEMAAKYGVDQWKLEKIQTLIHPLLVIPVINGTMLSVWGLILKVLVKAHGSVKGPQRSHRASVSSTDYQSGVEISGGDCLAEASFSGRVSPSVADDGETAVVISLVEGNQKYQESDVSEDMDNKVLSNPVSSASNAEALPEQRSSLDPHSCVQKMEESLSPAEKKIHADDAVERAPTHSNNKMTEFGLVLDLDMKNNNISEDQVARYLEANNSCEYDAQ